MDTAPVMLNVETALATCRGDPALVRALVEQYRANLPEERTGLTQALAATPPDWEAVRQRAHRLRSGSGYLGAERIAAAARDLEAGILACESTDALTAAWDALEGAFEEWLAVPVEEWERQWRVVHRPAIGAVP